MDAFLLDFPGNPVWSFASVVLLAVALSLPKTRRTVMPAPVVAAPVQSE